MTAKTHKSGFMSQSVAPVELNMLPPPMMYFVIGQTNPITRVFLPALFEANPRGLVVGIPPFDGMVEGQELKVSLTSNKETTVLTHTVEGMGDQGVGVTKEQILVHQGEQVEVSYKAFIDGVEMPSFPYFFTVAEAKLELDKLPIVDQMDAKDGVISLADIEAQGGALFRLSPIPGLYRGMLLSIVFNAGPIEYVVGKVISTTPDVNIDFLATHIKLEMFIGLEVTFFYSLWMLEDIAYSSHSSSYKFRVVS